MHAWIYDGCWLIVKGFTFDYQLLVIYGRVRTEEWERYFFPGGGGGQTIDDMLQIYNRRGINSNWHFANTMNAGEAGNVPPMYAMEIHSEKWRGGILTFPAIA